MAGKRPSKDLTITELDDDSNNNNNTDEVTLQAEPPSPLTANQIRDLIDILRQPISDREAMIPISNQAYRKGRLKPPLVKRRLNEGEAVLEEVVSFTFPDGRRQELTRREAIAQLEQERRDILAKMRASMSNSAAAAAAAAMGESINDTSSNNHDNNESIPLKPALKKPSTTITRKVTDTNTASDDCKIPSKTSATVLPFFEIRETLEESNNNMRGEVIDVTAQLHQLQKMNDNTVVVESKQDDDEDNMDFQGYEIPEEQVPGPVSDNHYDHLVSRLDALAKLEDNTESNKGSKKFSLGWSKGFLNKPKAAAAAACKKKASPQSTSKKAVAFNESVAVTPSVQQQEHQPSTVQPISTKSNSINLNSVKERPRKSNDNASSSVAAAAAETDKPMSRFAKERQSLR